MNAHHYQCDWHLDQYDFECNCGIKCARHPIMDLYPHDRAPTKDEMDSAAMTVALGSVAQ